MDTARTIVPHVDKVVLAYTRLKPFVVVVVICFYPQEARKAVLHSIT